MLSILRNIIEIHKELCLSEEKSINSIISPKDKALVSSHLNIKKKAREEFLKEIEYKTGINLEF